MIPGEAWAALGIIGGAIATGLFTWLTAKRGAPANDAAVATPASVTDAYDVAIRTLSAALDGLQEDQIADRQRITLLERERDEMRQRLGILEVAWEYIGSLLSQWSDDAPPEPPGTLWPHVPEQIRRVIEARFPHLGRTASRRE